MLDESVLGVLKTDDQREAWARVGAGTKQWCRNRSDALAAIDGYEFDVGTGAFVVWWIERYCRLYEGEWAGEPMRLRGLHSETLDWEIPDEFDEAQAIARAERYNQGFLAGEPADWQYECTLRMFSWVRWSQRWERRVRRFRQASIWVPKKSKKSPTLVGWGLYLLCGDAEEGQKVFLGAKDGSQAREIAGEHAVAMLKQSQELLDSCSLNVTRMRITHIPTRSFLQPMSSSNARTQESKHGINGCVLIDETHVVDREYMGIVSRAGISRSEPIHAEFSTAGNNLNSYGKERFDHATRVANGDAIDPALFVAIYAAPQDVTDTEIKADPIKYGRMANPAWGHTIDQDEFLADFHRSQASIMEFQRFKTYRLNLWQGSETPWLNASDWEACFSSKRLEDFAREQCVLTIDKSKTRDMTALMLTFCKCSDRHAWTKDKKGTRSVCRFCGAVDVSDEPRIEGCSDAREFWQFPVFWLPEETAKLQADKVPFLDWADHGYLQLIPGEVVQDGYLKRAIREFAQMFDIRRVYYDRTYCEDLTQWITEELYIERMEFPQNSRTMSAPIEDFERFVAQRLVHQDGNDVMAWQIRHCQVRIDSGGRQMLVKPRSRDDVRKVDGVVAGVMGVAAALDAKLANKLSGAWSGAPGSGMWG